MTIFVCGCKWQLEIYTRCYGDQPLVIQGAGAGNDTTAAGVLADIVDIQDLFTWGKKFLCLEFTLESCWSDFKF